MTYAPAERPFYDADSHIMELPNFLKDYADPSIRDEVPEVSYSASLVTDAEVDIIMEQVLRNNWFSPPTVSPCPFIQAKRNRSN